MLGKKQKKSITRHEKWLKQINITIIVNVHVIIYYNIQQVHIVLGHTVGSKRCW